MIKDKDEFDLLKNTLEYNPLTGKFTSLVNSKARKIGAVLGTISVDGYVVIRFNGKIVPAHRLAFLYMTGEWPPMFVDHIDRDRTNNKWENLRLADWTINNRNRSVQRNNTSGVVGVSWDKISNKWYATICVDGKMIGIGRYTLKEDAISARKDAEEKYNYCVDKPVPTD